MARSGSSLLRKERVAAYLESIGQEFLISHLTTLEPPQRENLLNSIRTACWDELQNTYAPPDVIQACPVEVVTLEDREHLSTEIDRIGHAAYANGEVAALLVAGGQGSRLGYDHPKGCFPIGPLSGNSLFQFHCEKILSVSEETGKPFPLLIMTSPATDDDTRKFLKEHSYFGLPPEHVSIFTQGMVPTCDANAQVLLAAPDQILKNPNGHGGCIEALAESGILERLSRLGVAEIIFIQVDNVLAPVFDPTGVGFRRFRNADTVTKVLLKADPLEKVGTMLKIGDRDHVIEYSDLPFTLRQPATEQEHALIAWGRPALEIYGVEFLRRFVASGARLPYHLAQKSVSAWTPEGFLERPGIKRERFIFDILPHARNVNLEVAREREFAPVKNLTGVDSVESAREILSKEYARWLREAGVEVVLEDGAYLEISPRFASTPEQLKRKIESLPDFPKLVRGNLHLV
ncbi:MAG: hypothetical protein GX589_08555 [Deltaproteobacteria bacterium]|nr:hypothetical protein [Deltaproteobacteria bacterium]